MGDTDISVVTRCSRIVATSASASRWSSATTTVTPLVSGHRTSMSDGSKLGEIWCSTRSRSSSGKTLSSQVSWLTSAECVTSTPFGVPVEPDV